MKILWVKANKILPVHSGGDLRSFNILRQLGAKHGVTFFSYYDGPADAEYDGKLSEQLPGAVCISTEREQNSSLARAIDYLSRLPQTAPYAVSRFGSDRVRARLHACVAERKPDVIVLDFLDAAINFPKHASIPTVLFQHNVESEIWRRHANNGSSGVKKLMYRLEFSKMLRYERAAVAEFDHVIAVSEHDRQLMSAWVDPRRITVVPTGVDTEQFCPGQSFNLQNPSSQDASSQNPLVMFVGAMDWEPNVDAVKYFCAEIWPHVLAKVPQAKFRIVGRNPDARVKALVSSSVEVTGRVPSVVEHLREAAVVVVPLRVGGGTRLKIYEAMAVGRAVVSTSVGAEGLDVHHERDIILSDTAANFAESVTSLLVNADYRGRVGRAAAERAAQYGWPMIGVKFGEILQSVIGQPAEAALTR